MITGAGRPSTDELVDQLLRNIVRSAAPKSIAKARPRPSAPVTSQARALSSADTSPLPRPRPIAQDLPPQALSLPRRDRALGALGIELDAPIPRQVEQPLLLDPLLRRLEEKPGEQAEAEEGALDHHDHPGRALVGQRRDPPVALA